MEKIYQILHEVREDVEYEKINNFVETEALDSIDIMTLVELLEENYSITISGKDIIPENFENIECISQLIIKCGGNL